MLLFLIIFNAGLSDGALIAIIIGSALLLLLIIGGVIVCCWCVMRPNFFNRKPAPPAAPQVANNPGPIMVAGYPNQGYTGYEFAGGNFLNF